MVSKKIILIGWSGADWQIARPLMEAGLMPCLSALVAGGVAGEMMGTAPFSAPMFWATVATGHDPDRHGILGCAEADPVGGQVRAVGSGSRRVKALWNLLSEQGRSVGVVGWPCSYPAEAVRGEFVADAFAQPSRGSTPEWAVAPGSLYPPELVEDLPGLRLRPQDVDNGLLGLFIPELRETGLRADPCLALLKLRLAELYTSHNAAITIAGRKQPDFLALQFAFLNQIGEEFVLYHPPKHPRVARSDQARFREVVTAAYRVQDALLGDLLRHCQPDTGVLLVSDHGFQTGESRPGPLLRRTGSPTALYRREGMMVVRGRGIARVGRLGAVRARDITPTMLAWMDLPRSEEMPGRVLNDLFAAPPVEASIPSWENHPPLWTPVGPAIVEADPVEGLRLTQRLVQENLLSPAVLLDGSGGELVAAENQARLGAALRELGRPVEALPRLQAAALADPESTAAAQELTHCLLDLGLAEEAEQAAKTIFDHGREQPPAIRLRVQLLMARGQVEQAMALFDASAGSGASGPVRDLQLLMLARSGRQREGRAVFQAEVRKNPERALLHLGLANACLRTGFLNEAVASATRALELDGGLELAKHLLAEAKKCQLENRLPQPPGWDELADHASRRMAWREELTGREKSFLAKRASGRESSAHPEGEQRATGGGCAPAFQPSISGEPAGSWRVRPPWPDECLRLERHFSPSAKTEPSQTRWSRVIEASDPDRMVGRAMMYEADVTKIPQVPPEESLRLHWEIRRGWREHPAAEALLLAAVAQARQMMARQVITGVTDKALLKLALRHGFKAVAHKEVGILSARQTLDQMRQKFGRIIEAAAIRIFPIAGADFDKVKKICGDLQLLTADRIRQAVPGFAGGYDPGLSFFAGDPANPALVLLGREYLGKVYMEILARNPELPDFSRVGIGAILVKFWEAVGELGLDETFYQVSKGTKAGLGPIVHRYGGRPTQFLATLRWQAE